MAGKKQFMALVEADTLYRLDRLRIVMGESRARVAEIVMRGRGLTAAEREHAEGIDKLTGIAERAGVSVPDLVAWYAATYTRQYGPGLDGLEEAYSNARSSSGAVVRAGRA